MTQIIEKTCTLCGMNLNGQKRMKSASGEYYCPECWRAQSAIFGEPTASAEPIAVQPTVKPPTIPKVLADVPIVRVVRSSPELTLKEAALAGLKEGAVTALWKLSGTVVVFVNMLVVLVLAKKFFPEANNGIMAILTVTSVLAGVTEMELLARAMHCDGVWLTNKELKSRLGILIIVGFVLAYALAIAITVAGG